MGLQCKRHCGLYSATSGSDWLADSRGWHQLGRVYLLPGSVLGSRVQSQAELSLYTQRKMYPDVSL